MTNKSDLKLTSLLVVAVVTLFAQGAYAAALAEIQKEGEKKLVEAEKSQKRIDKIVAGAQERLIRYRALMKQIEGLETYNDQLSTQVASQEGLIERFDQSISQVALIKRQMSPLLSSMAESLEKFVELDLPFHTAERQERMALIRENLASTEIDMAEKFRQVIEAYQIENEYGRKIDSYQSIVDLNGVEYEVDVLRVGRVALLCQSKDTKISARWDNALKIWVELDNATYRNSIRKGIKMAKKQASIDILTLPISAPELAAVTEAGE